MFRFKLGIVTCEICLQLALSKSVGVLRYDFFFFQVTALHVIHLTDAVTRTCLTG